jgi:hypothetical protein
MDRKTALVASALAFAASAATAGIDFTHTGDATFTKLFNPDGGVFAAGAYTSGEMGFFTATSNDNFTLTYLGQESVFRDGITIRLNGAELNEGNAVGDWISGTMTAGELLDFEFFGSDGTTVANGDSPEAMHPSWVLLGTNVQTSHGMFQYVIGYNDSANHDDWDDYVVGINAVPEPQTYALLLAGLGVVGFVARRRRG